MNAAQRQAQDWVQVLRLACESRSQASVAAMIEYSPSVVNQVLKGTYKGDWGAVEFAVRGALLNHTVECPVLGELEAHRCLHIQKQPFAATNPIRVRLYRACRTCTHWRA